MNTFLLLFSLLLNGVTIFAIIVLFTRQNRLLQVERKQENMIRDMEELISSYVAEMKEENEQFIARFKQIGNESPAGDTKLPFNSMLKSDETPRVEDSLKLPNATNASRQVAARAYGQQSTVMNKKKLLPSDEDFMSIIGSNSEDSALIETKEAEETKKQSVQEEIKEISLLSQVLVLQAKGLTVGEIAKKLNKGKTEIELLLKFRQNRQE